ncbi:hypothetical protein Aperf_G00000071042 [Anoplocephala perfoliata]
MLRSNDSSHVSVILFSVHKTAISPESFSMIDEDEVDSADATARESGPVYLDTITEEEEDDPSSSSSLGTSGKVTIQHHCSPIDRANSDSDLLEANYFIGATSDSMDWFVGETNLDHDQFPYQQRSSGNLCTSVPVEIFPVQLEAVALHTTTYPNEKILQHSSLPYQTYMNRSGSKSLPSIALSPETHPLQRNLTSSNICTLLLDGTSKLTNSKVPSPTRTQLHDVAEWDVSSPGVNMITDMTAIELHSRETPSSHAAVINCSTDTENDVGNDVYEKEVLEIHNGLSKMKRSPAVEGVNVLLEHNNASLNDLGSNSREVADNGSPIDVASISVSESSSSSSALSLSQRYSESPPILSRPVYDYGTDETLLEIFMTPAVEGMESGGENSSLNGSKKRLLTSLAFDNLVMGPVWRDTCKEKPEVTDTEKQYANFYEEFDLPFIDNEESYSEAWYITASQQFSWLDRAELADFEEIILYYADSSVQPDAEEKGRKLIDHPIKFRLPKRHKQKDISAPRKIPDFQRGLTKPGKEKSRWTSWMRQLCGCISGNHTIV